MYKCSWCHEHNCVCLGWKEKRLLTALVLSVQKYCSDGLEEECKQLLLQTNTKVSELDFRNILNEITHTPSR